MRRAGPANHERQRGQGLVEFSLALIPFLFLLLGTIDLGRGIYTSNGVAQAAREIARVASVHQCAGPCTSATWSAEILEVVNAQRALLPGLRTADIMIECVEIDDTVWAVTSSCLDGKFIRVRTSATFGLVTPLLPIPNPFTVSSTAHVQVP
jgi:hypothetical protein